MGMVHYRRIGEFLANRFLLSLVALLRLRGRMTAAEIAEELDIPVSTVRGLLARARKDIIVRMEQWR